MEQKNNSAFTLIELLVTIGIIGILATLVIVALSKTTVSARDAKRIAEINSFARFLQFGCRAPAHGTDVDVLDFANELKNQNPQYATFLTTIPKDPRLGSNTQSGYRYIISEDGKKCAIYINLENEDADIQLTDITTPTPGGGTGVFKTATPGPNNTLKYYQFSN